LYSLISVICYSNSGTKGILRIPVGYVYYAPPHIDETSQRPTSFEFGAFYFEIPKKKTAQEMDDKEREVDVTSLDNIIRSLVESLNYFPVSAIPQNSQQQQQQQKKG
jgi:hypothetical protein